MSDVKGVSFGARTQFRGTRRRTRRPASERAKRRRIAPLQTQGVWRQAQLQSAPYGFGSPAVVLAVLALVKVVPYVINAFRTVSTDDAYVNGHVTFVAPRVPGQVVRVLVDDNNRVQRGNLLVQLDKEPYRVDGGYRKGRGSGCPSQYCRSPGQGSGTRRTGAQPALRVGAGDRAGPRSGRRPACQSCSLAGSKCDARKGPGRLPARAAAAEASGDLAGAIRFVPGSV